MAMPTIVGVGPKGSGTGNVQYLFTGVSYQADDIGLLFIETNVATTISVDQGWAQVSSSPQTATATRLHLYWKRLSASETGPTATQGGTTDHQCGGIIVIRGCIKAGNPWDITNGSTETTSDTSVSVPGGTTTVANCLVLAATSSGVDSNTAQGTGTPSSTGLANVAYTALNYQTNAGGGGGVVVMKGEKAAKGAYGPSLMTLVSASDKGLINIALKEEPPTVQGNVSVSFTPGSTGLPQYAVTGAVSVSLTPQAAIEVQLPVKYLVERGQVVVNQKLSEYGTRMLPYAVDESGTVANTDRPPAQDFYYDGDVTFSLIPSHTKVVEYVYQGNLGFSFAPQATATREWVVQGAVSLSLMPGATVTREWVVQGNILVSFLPGSQSLPEYVRTGSVSFALSPGSQSLPEYVKAGALSVSFIPGATVTREWMVTGDVSFFALIPQASITRDWTIQGNILFTLTPSHTLTREWVITSDVTVSLIPNSTCYYEGPSEYIVYGDISMCLMPGAVVAPEWVTQGNIPFTLVPGASSTFEATVQGSILLLLLPGASSIMEAMVQGNVPLFLLPGASSAFEIAIQGAIPLSLIPEASSILEAVVHGDIQLSLFPGAIALSEATYQGDITFALVPHSSTSFAVEWEIIGDIAFALYLRGIEKFTKPEGHYGYDWDPSKHFFVEGKNYDASLEFGLDKRLPIKEGGEYKYDA